MRCIGILISLLVLSIPVASHATTGAELRESCGAFDTRANSHDVSIHMQRTSQCTGYIYGVLDLPMVSEVRGADYCPPDGTTRDAAALVVREYVRRPEIAKMTAAGSGAQVVINAMMAKWPCKGAR